MDEFDPYRAEMNEKLFSSEHLGIKLRRAIDRLDQILAEPATTPVARHNHE